MERGYVHVYTGNGKGKTTAALGLCLRALGAGKRVYIGQFIKGMKYSEISMLDRMSEMLGPGRLTVRQYGRGCFVFRNPEQADYDAAIQGLAQAQDAAVSALYDLVILDEVLVAVKLGLLPESSVLALLDARPLGLELILTGRGASEALMARADLVTEMKEIKHYYAQGVEAREGIER